MPDVHIPQSLFEQIATVAFPPQSPEEFVLEAVREKLSSEERKGEFYRLSDQTRAAMKKKRLTEADILADFESFRAAADGPDRG